MRAGSGAGEPCRGRRVILIRRELTAMQSLRGRNLLCYSWAPCLRLRPTGLLFLLVHWHASWMAGVGIATSEHLAASSSTNGYVLGGLAASMPRLSLRGGGRPREAPGGRTRGSASTKRASSKRNTQDGGLVKDAEEAFAAGRYEDAAKIYTEAIGERGGSGAPKDKEARTALVSNRAACYLKMGKADQTIADCNTVLRHQPGSAKALLRRGLAKEMKQDFEGAAKDMRNALNVQPELQQAMQCLRRCQGSGAGKDAKENDGDVQAARQAKKGGQMPASQPDGSNAATGGSRAERTRRRKQDDGDAALRDALFSKFGKDFRAAGAAGREFQLSGKVPASFKPDISDDDDDDKGEEGENGFAGSGGDDDDASDDDVSELEGKETKEETGQDVAPFAKGATKREHEANAGKKIADARPRRDDFHVLAGKKLATAQHAKVKPLAPIKTKVGVEKGDAPLLVPQIANEEVQGDMDRDDLDGDEEKVDDEEDSTDSTSDVSDVSDGAVIGYEDVMEAVKAGKEKHDGEEENPRRKKIIELARQLVEEGDGSDDDSRESSGSDSSTSDSDSGKQDEDDDQDDEEGKKRNVSSVAPTRGANLTFSQAAERRVSAKLLKAERRALFEREANNTFRDKERDRRTVFVGNIPTEPQHHRTKSSLLALFRPYGKVDSLRFRSFAVESSKISKSEAFRRRQFAAQKQFMNAYVVFAKEDAARKAAAAVNGARLTVRFNPHELKQAQKNKTAGTNATVWEGLSEVPGGYSHNITTVLRCDLASGASYVSSRCIFVGNVPFTGVNEQDMWKLFAKCGKIENVRMVRDKWTGVGKGFCYVQFEKEDSVLKAVELNQHNETKPIIRIGKKKFDLRVCSAKKPLALARGKKLHEMRNKGGREAFKKRMKRWKNRKEKRHQMSTGKRPSQEKKLIRAGEKRRLPPPGREQGGGADSHRGKAGREGRGSGKDKGRWEAKKGGKFGKDGNRKARREGLQGSGGGQEGHD